MFCRIRSHVAMDRHGTVKRITSSLIHYNDVIMRAITSQITSLTIVYSIVYSDADQRKHQSSASLGFVQGVHRGPVNSPHKWPVTPKMFPFDDVIMHSGDYADKLWGNDEWSMNPQNSFARRFTVINHIYGENFKRGFSRPHRWYLWRNLLTYGFIKQD